MIGLKKRNIKKMLKLGAKAEEIRKHGMLNPMHGL